MTKRYCSHLKCHYRRSSRLGGGLICLFKISRVETPGDRPYIRSALITTNRQKTKHFFIFSTVLVNNCLNISVKLLKLFLIITKYMQIGYLGTETVCVVLFGVVLILTRRWRPRTGIKPCFYKPQNKKQPLLGLKYYL